MLQHHFVEHPLVLGMHPHAQQVVIGLKEGVKIFYPIEDELRQVFFEALKGCQAVAYSESGSLLACGNSNHINLYNPYSFELLQQLMGHPSQIKSLRFCYGLNNDDSQDKCTLLLSSTCTNGVLYVWNTVSGQRLREHSWKGSKLNCQFYDEKYEISFDSDQEVIRAASAGGRMEGKMR